MKSDFGGGSGWGGAVGGGGSNTELGKDASVLTQCRNVKDVMVGVKERTGVTTRGEMTFLCNDLYCIMNPGVHTWIHLFFDRAG